MSSHPIYSVSNPDIVKQRYITLYKPSNPDTLFISNKKNKKYAVLNPSTNKLIHFGDIRYEDYTYHKDVSRLQSFHKRFNEVDDEPYSPLNLSRNLLW